MSICEASDEFIATIYSAKLYVLAFYPVTVLTRLTSGRHLKKNHPSCNLVRYV